MGIRAGITTSRINADTLNVAGVVTATSFNGNLDASDLASGTIPDARFPATLPTASGANLTNLPSSQLTGALPAIDGSALTSVTASSPSRATTTATTSSIAQAASADITIPTPGKSFALLKIAIDAPAWVVLYTDTSSRTSDASRTEEQIQHLVLVY